MLLQENRGQTDQECNAGKSCFPTYFLQFRCIPSGSPDTYGTDHMNGRAYVGIGIKPIEFRHEAGKEVIPFEFHRTQVLAGRENQVNHDGDRDGNDREFHQFPEGGHIVK